MADKVYAINKGVGRVVEFKGLKGQYIRYVGGGLVATLVLFGVMYAVGLNVYVSMMVAFGMGGMLIGRIYRISKRFGQFGMMKWTARRGIPKALVSRSRKIFILLNERDGNEVG